MRYSHWLIPLNDRGGGDESDRVPWGLMKSNAKIGMALFEKRFRFAALLHFLIFYAWFVQLIAGCIRQLI